MKKSIAKLLGCVFAGCMVLSVCAGIMGVHGAGSADDPLITYSYVQNVLLPKLKEGMTQKSEKLFEGSKRAEELDSHGKDGIESLVPEKNAEEIAGRLTSTVTELSVPSVTGQRKITIGPLRGIIADVGATVTVLNGNVRFVPATEGSMILVSERSEFDSEKTISSGDYAVVTEKGKVFFLAGEEAVVMVTGRTKFAAPVSGKVSFSGTAKEGETVSAVLDGIVGEGTFECRWLLNGTFAASGNKFTLPEGSGGKNLVLEVIATEGCCGKLATSPVAVSGKSSGSSASITRVFGSDRYETAFDVADMLKEAMGVEKFENVVVASGLDFADALSGSYLANTKNAPILLVRNKDIDKVRDYIKANLVTGGTVYILGGPNAVPEKMESGLGEYKVKRLAGANRYETNIEILKEAGVSGKDVLVCTGLEFADGLSASAVNLPILLVNSRKLTDVQTAFLSENSIGRIYIVGGTNAINENIEAGLKSFGEVSRISGSNRYETSANLANTFCPGAKAAVVAYGQNFPDGLSGGCLAYRLGGPLLLAEDRRADPAKNCVSANGIKSGAVLGGSGLISDKTVCKIFGMLDGSVITVR